MKAKIYLINGNTINLDEFATDMIFKSIHSKELSNSLIIVHVADKTGKLRYSVPLNSVSYIEYID